MKNLLVKFSPLVLLLFLFLGCNFADKLKEKITEAGKPQTMACADGSCEITVPAFWSKATGLNDRAILQAEATAREEYVIVTRQTRSDFSEDATLDDFVSSVRADLLAQVPDGLQTAPVSTQINGYNAREFEVSGTVTKIKVKYLYAVIETKTNFYQVISWTLPSVYDKNRDELVTTMHTFKETLSNAPSSLPGQKGPAR